MSKYFKAVVKKNALMVTGTEAQRIGEMLGITFKIFTADQLAKGINHENAEHGDITFGDTMIAAKIARPHLEEDPEYYDKLEKAIENSKEKVNAKELPKRYYCRAMESGVCEYDKERILLTNDALKKMAPSAEGVPVYVQHVANVDMKNLQNEADGFVTRCFYNEVDGGWWQEFLAVSDLAHEKIRKGWKVSTAYMPTQASESGTFHNVKYDREITNGYYTHLAIVDKPRYENAIIMTPEQFQEYNEGKAAELKELKNSHKESIGGEIMSKFKVFLNKLVGTSKDEIADPSNVMIEGENGQKISLAEIINAVEEEEKKEKEKGKEMEYNEDTEVSVGEKKMKLGALMAKYNKMKKNAEDEATKEKEKEEKEKEQAKKNEEEKEKAKEEERQNAIKKAEEEAKAKKHFEQLNNAHKETQTQVVETSQDKVARGKDRYGN